MMADGDWTEHWMWLVVSWWTGDPQDDQWSDGPQDEPAGLQPQEYAPRSATDEPTLSSQHPQVPPFNSLV